MSRTKATIRVCGLDPSLRNWGIALGTYDLVSRTLQIDKLDLVQPDLPTGKKIRQNSLDLESAQQLYRGAAAAITGCHAVFVEVPHGSQSSRAMASYGIVVGVLGALRANGLPFFELNEQEVKLASVGKTDKKVTKQDMIHWARGRHPEANWPTYKQNGELLLSEAKAEHMADAVAAIYAGLACNPFQQMLPFLAQYHSPTFTEETHANSFT